MGVGRAVSEQTFTQDSDKEELKHCLSEFHRLMADPVVLAGMLLEILEKMRAAGNLPPPPQ